MSGRKLGEVGDLLLDARARNIVLLDVDVAGTDRHTLVPVSVVRIDRARRLVLMDSADLPEALADDPSRPGHTQAEISDAERRRRSRRRIDRMGTGF